MFSKLAQIMNKIIKKIKKILIFVNICNINLNFYYFFLHIKLKKILYLKHPIKLFCNNTHT